MISIPQSAILHSSLAEQLLSDEMSYDREQIEYQCRLGKGGLNEELLRLFNAHLNTEEIEHKAMKEYKRHLRSWIVTKPKHENRFSHKGRPDIDATVSAADQILSEYSSQVNGTGNNK